MTETTNENLKENITMNIDDDDDENKQTKENVNEMTAKNQQIDLTKNITTNISLLVNLKRIVDVCVYRGAFKSEELSQIGSVVDTLNGIIKENIE